MPRHNLDMFDNLLLDLQHQELQGNDNPSEGRGMRWQHQQPGTDISAHPGQHGEALSCSAQDNAKSKPQRLSTFKDA